MDSVKYSVSSVAIRGFLEELNEFRKQNIFCDVNIIVQDQTFPCHRNILSSASTYFKTMFVGNFKEIHAPQVNMQNIEAVIFEQILDFIYLGDIIINGENISNLLITSEYLGLEHVEELCLSYIEKHAPMDNVVDLLAFAVETRQTRLSGMLYKHVAENFVALSESDKLIRLPADSVIIILSHANLQPYSDRVLESFFARWMKSRPKLSQQANVKNFCFNARVLGKVLVEKKAETMPVKTLNATNQFLRLMTLESRKSSIDRFRVGCHLLTSPAKLFLSKSISEESSNRFSISRFMNISLRMRRPPQTTAAKVFHSSSMTKEFSKKFSFCKFVKIDERVMYSYMKRDDSAWIGAWDTTLEHSEIAIPKKKIFRVVPREFCNFSKAIMAPVQHQIYFYDLIVREPSIDRVLALYNCERDQWLSQGEQQNLTYVVHPCMVSLDDSLYLIGGRDYYNRDCNALVNGGGLAQSLDPRTSRWNTLPNSLYDHTNATACVHSGKIYVAGGDNLSYVRSAVEVFDPVAGKWNILAPMPKQRMNHVLVSYEKKIYAVGGAMHRINGREQCDRSFCEYNVEEDKWANTGQMNFNLTNCFELTEILDVFVC